MSPPETVSNWDLTPVITLLHSFQLGEHRSPGSLLSTKHQSLAKERPQQDAGDKSNDVDGYRKLGDFSAIWDYLAKTPSRQQDGVSKGEAHLDPPANILRHCKNERPVMISGEVKGVQNSEGKIVLLRRSQAPKRDKKSAESPTVSATPCRKKAKASPSKNHGRLLSKQSSDEDATSTLPTGSKNVLATPKFRLRVEPVLSGTPEEKKLGLISKLRERCANDRKRLANPKLLDPSFALSNTSNDGIHVFVDMSNIMVGFHDIIKSARDIPLTTRVPRLPLSFHNFTLILERGRPVSKRVLVGSDRFPAIDEAENLGYETNILERVQKVKSPRKKKVTNGNKSHDQSSESETNAMSQLQRWVEQAVDEIVHLKMLESIVDTAQPSTIVLATGDAAEAEYSGGFMKMVERALEKGWRVELVSFSSTASRAYSRKDFRAKWSSRFVIIKLDEYAEYLLDMHA